MGECAKMKLVGKRIREIRKNKNLTQADLASLTGMAPSNISEIESGKTSIKLTTFCRLVEVLQVSADDVLRANVPAGRQSCKQEYVALLEDCTPEEIDTINGFVRNLKATLRSKD